MNDCRSGIYVIRRIGTDQCYVGSSQHLPRRLKQHLGMLLRGGHDSPRLQYAWNKHGEAAFSFEVLEHCATDQLIEREQYFIDDLKPVFNSGVVAHPPMRGHQHTAESRAKMAAAAKARWTNEARAEMAAKIRGKKNALGVKRTPEQIEAIRRRATGRTHTVTDESRRLMSLAQMGNRNKLGFVNPASTRAKLSAALKGRVFKPETIARMCLGQQARWARVRALASGSI